MGVQGQQQVASRLLSRHSTREGSRPRHEGSHQRHASFSLATGTNEDESFKDSLMDSRLKTLKKGFTLSNLAYAAVDAAADVTRLGSAAIQSLSLSLTLILTLMGRL